MKTYTFAPKGESTAAHMQGLTEGLKLWVRDCDRRRAQKISQRDDAYWKGKREALEDALINKRRKKDRPPAWAA